MRLLSAYLGRLCIRNPVDLEELPVVHQWRSKPLCHLLLGLAGQLII